MKRTGFTLIELLIVVAIIAILAAIAVPNFLEAQTRSKVSRAKADMRSLATALEAYYVDENRYPHDRNHSGTFGLPWPTDPFISSQQAITTPIAYMTSVNLDDPFFNAAFNPEPTYPVVDVSFKYFNTGYGKPGSNPQPEGFANWGDLIWNNSLNTGPFASKQAPFAGYALVSYGPDVAMGRPPAFDASSRGEWLSLGLGMIEATNSEVCPYDPTNGTVSRGDIVRTGGGADSVVNGL